MDLNNGFFLYRFKNSEDDIIYVGKSINIKSRMRQHFGTSGHLDAMCYSQVEVVEFMEVSTKTEMDIRELYYISKWAPKYNTACKREEMLEINLPEAKWEILERRGDRRIKDLEIQLATILKERGDMETSYRLIKQEKAVLEVELSSYKSIKTDLNLTDKVSYCLNDAVKHLNENPESRLHSSISTNGNLTCNFILYASLGDVYLMETESGWVVNYTRYKKDIMTVDFGDYKYLVISDICEFTPIPLPQTA